MWIADKTQRVVHAETRQDGSDRRRATKVTERERDHVKRHREMEALIKKKKKQMKQGEDKEGEKGILAPVNEAFVTSACCRQRLAGTVSSQCLCMNM